MSEFDIRAYQAGDEAGILELFRTCFFVDRTEAHWRWKYHDNPYGRHHISVAAADGGGIVAHYGGYPIPIWHDQPGNRRTIMAFQVGDSMTHPDVRGVGRGRTSLIARTADHFLSTNGKDKIGFTIGFNTGGIYRFCVRYIGGSLFEPVCFWSAASAGIPSPPLDLRYRVKRTRRLDESWDSFFYHVAPAYGLLVKRDRQYLEWRYMQCPDNCFYFFSVFKLRRLVGWSVFRRKANTMIWGDGLFDPDEPDAARRLLYTAIRHRHFAKVSRIEAWFATQPSAWQEQLRYLGFEREQEPNSLMYIYKPYLEDTIGDHLKSSYYTMGDSDLF